jgi:hypothetical protein
MTVPTICVCGVLFHPAEIKAGEKIEGVLGQSMRLCKPFLNRLHECRATVLPPNVILTDWRQQSG